MNKAEEIFKAWASSLNPTKFEQKVARDRISICNDCEFKSKQIWTYHCSICKCPLSKKVFSPVPNGCPKLFWYDVDKKNGMIKDDKSIKTLF